jgi:hypothetical protein
MSETAARAARELSALSRGIGDVHRAISRRVFGALGPMAAPVRPCTTRSRAASTAPGAAPAADRARSAAGALGDGAGGAQRADRRAGHAAARGLGETESAWGAPSCALLDDSASVGFKVATGLALGGTHHFALRNHP